VDAIEPAETGRKLAVTSGINVVSIDELAQLVQGGFSHFVLVLKRMDVRQFLRGEQRQQPWEEAFLLIERVPVPVGVEKAENRLQGVERCCAV
jgi:hypothetical protein